ncbi:MAG: response regulator transcription factor [Fischerella sp.]|nr:response regulator transcription factor [Fischerella sp.]
MIRVLVVAASSVIRAGLFAVLTSDPRLVIAGSSSNLDVLSTEITQLQPDVVLLDLSGHPQDIEWKQQYPTAIIVIVDESKSIDLEAALRAGVRGVLLNVCTESEIIAAVEAVASGLVVLHPDAIEYLLNLSELSASNPALLNPVQALTPREIEVLDMLSSGLSNKAIAKRLHISEHTVKFHVSSIFQKLGVSTRTEAVTVGVRLGLIML